MHQTPNITPTQKPHSGSGAAWAVGWRWGFAPDPIEHKRVLGSKWYELSNHLGNFLAVVTDRKRVVEDGQGAFSHYISDVVHSGDYNASNML